MSDASIISDLWDRVWLRYTFKLIRLKREHAIAWLPELGGTSTSKKADLVGVNKDKKVFAFEVKPPEVRRLENLKYHRDKWLSRRTQQ